jgi:hypothetical protein
MPQKPKAFRYTQVYFGKGDCTISNLLLEKSNNFAEGVIRAQFNNQQAWTAYGCCYIPSMVYSLTAVNLTKTQLVTIQQKTISNYIQTDSFKITFPKVIVHGTNSCGGLGFQHWYVKNNIGKIEAIKCHINKNSTRLIYDNKFEVDTTPRRDWHPSITKYK